MMEPGLAEIGGVLPQTPPTQDQAQPQPQMIPIQELVELLKQGITPQELVQNGVPMELVDQALAVLQQEVQAGQQGPAIPQQGGLADMYMGQGVV